MEIIYNAAIKMPEVDAEIVLAELANYRAKSGFFSKHFLWQSVNLITPVAWWKGVCGATELSKLAVRFLELPATSAACERTFSTYGGVHTLKRNRLTNDRAGKLVYISQNLKLIKEIGSCSVKESSMQSNNDVQIISQSQPSCSGIGLKSQKNVETRPSTDTDDDSDDSTNVLNCESSTNSASVVSEEDGEDDLKD